MRPLLIVLAVVALLYGLHRLALFADYRGWIYYRTRPPRMRSLGLLEELADPSVEYRIEEQSSEAVRADQDLSGDPPTRWTSRHRAPPSGPSFAPSRWAPHTPLATVMG